MPREPNSADHVARTLATEGGSVSVSGKVFPKLGGEFSGDGTLVRQRNRFILRLTFPVGGEPPDVKGGTFSRADCWRFEGAVGANVPVAVEDLFPGGARHWNNGITSQEFDAGVVQLKPAGLDAIPARVFSPLIDALEREAKQNGREIPKKVVFDVPPIEERDSNQGSQTPSPYAAGVWIHALVLGYPLIHTNGVTETLETNDFLGEARRSAADTFSGTFDGVQYGLVRRGEDLNIYLFVQSATDETIGLGNHKALLSAFLTALAFGTGQHCWPYRTIIRQNGRVLSDELHATRAVGITSLAPFSERIGFNAKVGNIEWEFGSFLEKGTKFFQNKSVLSTACSKALWLVRASDAKGIPMEIKLSSLCVLMESLTGSVFAALNLESSKDVELFAEAQQKALEWLDAQAKRSEFGYSRLYNMISSASLLRPLDKFRAVCKHYKIQWEGLMEDAWNIWKTVRHKSVHAALAADENPRIDDRFTAVGRIAGAINVIILRVIGYSGIARTSVFEDKHHKI